MTFTICVTLILGTSIVGAFTYAINDRNNMSKNIETAINKGIDPIAVKCAYETEVKTVCALYAANKK